jgi:DNA polymerase V
MRGDHTERVWRMRERVGQWLGLPMGGGIGKTLTLAKLASHISKQAFRRPGIYPSELAHVCNLGQCAPSLLRDCMANTPVNEVWGIGRRYSAQLIDGGILTALDLANMDAGTVRARWGVNMERTVRELNGIACIDVEGSSTRQQIMCSRSLSKPVESCHELQQLGSLFASNAARKLRQQGSVSKAVSVFAMSSPFRDGPRFARSRVVPLTRATDDSRKLCTAAAAGMRSIFEAGYNIVKVGVMLMDISSREEAMAQGQLLFDDCADVTKEGPLSYKEHALMLAVDAVNERYGRNCLRTASTTVKSYSRQELRTPHYTTNLQDAPIARA